MSKTINNCRSCGSRSLRRFLDFGNQPLANSLESEALPAGKKHELCLCHCAECGLIQLTVDVPREKMFSNYLWVTGTSKTAKSYAYKICSELLHYANIESSDSLIFEVASNDGTFLIPFKQQGYRVLGVDPAKNLAQLANSNGITTIEDFFSLALAKKLKKQHGSAKIVLCRNVLAHVPNIAEFLLGLAEILSSDGVLLIEVHYAGSILEGLQYDSIYHEHASYISLVSIMPRLEELGLKIFHISLGPISGGSLTLYIKKGSNKEIVVEDSVGKFERKESNSAIKSIATWTNFATEVLHHSGELAMILRERRARGMHICGFGASARSSTLLNFAGIDSSIIKMIADSNPNKHGLMTAGTRIPIVVPWRMFETNPDLIVILAWNFRQEIVSIIRESGYEGELLVPLPGKPQLV